MTRVRALVLRAEPGVIVPQQGYVPVTENSDPSKPPIGRATLEIAQNGDVYADIEFFGEPPPGTPAVSLRDSTIGSIGISMAGNVDPTIPPLAREPA